MWTFELPASVVALAMPPDAIADLLLVRTPPPLPPHADVRLLCYARTSVCVCIFVVVCGCVCGCVWLCVRMCSCLCIKCIHTELPYNSLSLPPALHCDTGGFVAVNLPRCCL